MNQKATKDAGQTEDVVLPDADALFGLELHRTTDGWTATTTGPHLPNAPLQRVALIDGTQNA